MWLFKAGLSAPFVPGHGIGLAASAPAVRLARGDLQLDIVDSLDGLARLGVEWNELFDRAGTPAQVFQTHGFAALFARTYGIGNKAGGKACSCSLAVVTARRRGRLVLVWPLSLGSELGLKVLSWLGEPVAQYGDVLLDPAERAAETLSCAWDHLCRSLKPDVVRLRNVRADAAVAPFLSALGVPAREVEHAPCITLAAGGSPFQSRQSGKARKNRRRLLRRLEEQGAVGFREIAAEPAAREAVASGLADKREWLARRGLLSPALADPRFKKFMLAAAGEASGSTGGSAFSLTLDGSPVALALGFRAKNRLMLHLISHAASVEKHGAGVLNLEAVLNLAEAEGLEAVDMLPPKAEYKLDWADTCVAVGDHTWGLSARGKAWCALYDGFLRPRGKDMIQRLPLSLRRRLLGGSCVAGQPADA